ncbi:MAG: pentapeptide repeat-containing protein [Cyanobacteriota bacterium]|nr:pentapeptide repeat-containing protein [Cyanobacteriota bacterium]
MSDEEFIQEAQDLIQRVVEAETNNFIEIAKIANLDLRTDLVGANLSHFDLSHADLSHADLSHADLSHADLSHADLSHADLSHADLSHADLSHANLTGAICNHANLTGAICNHANLTDTILFLTNIEDAIVEDCKTDDLEYGQQSNLLLSYLSYGDLPNANLKNVKQFIEKFAATQKSTAENEFERTSECTKYYTEINKVIELISQETKYYTEKSKSDFLKKAKNRSQYIEEKLKIQHIRKIEEFEQLLNTHSLTSLKLKNDKDENQSELFSWYLERYQSFEEKLRTFQYRYEIEDIENSFKACQEAAIWLANNRAKIQDEVKQLIVSSYLDTEILNRVELSPEQVEQFGYSINIYLLWIEHHISKGSVPEPFPKELILLALPEEYYVKVFEFIKTSKISTEHGLSEQAVYHLRGYLSRFLINPLSKSEI